jgi:biopolymer transport protein ExbB
VFDLVRQGGPVMIPILLISVAAIGLIIERALAFARAREKRADIGAWVIERMEKGGTGELAGELGASPSPESQVLLEGLKCRNLPAAEREARMQAKAVREIGRLERSVPWLSSIANIETLLGLLGTVTGMIRSFLSLRLSGVADPAVLAGGIAEALITTAAGLLVAIPSLAAYHVFNQIIDRTTTRVEAAATDVQSFLARRRGVA